MLMPADERNRVAGIRLAAQRGERRARVRERVDADAEPGDAVAAGDADQAEDENDDDLVDREVLQHAEVQRDDRADEDLENEDELALRDQIRLAGLVDQLGDLAHRLVHGHVLELRVDHDAEDQAERADDQAAHEQRVPVHAAEERDRERSGMTRFASPPAACGLRQPRRRRGCLRRLSVDAMRHAAAPTSKAMTSSKHDGEDTAERVLHQIHRL